MFFAFYDEKSLHLQAFDVIDSSECATFKQVKDSF
jgi:hypothetical protein